MLRKLKSRCTLLACSEKLHDDRSELQEVVESCLFGTGPAKCQSSAEVPPPRLGKRDPHFWSAFLAPAILPRSDVDLTAFNNR